MPGEGGGRFPRFANEDELQAKIEGQVHELSGDGVRVTVQMARTSVGGAAPPWSHSARRAAAGQCHAAAAAHLPVPGARGPRWQP
jgi:hypothetical protein